MNLADVITEQFEKSGGGLDWKDPMHVGGRCYAAFSDGVLNLADGCRQGEEGEILPDGNTIALNQKDWEELFGYYRPGIEKHLDIENTVPCYLHDSHANQEILMFCSECNPFPDDFYWY